MNKIQLLNRRVQTGSQSLSVLDECLNNNIYIEHSCKTGQCGVCKTTLVVGEVVELQEQLALSDEDRQKCQILTCCCKPKTDIVIDAEELSVLRDIEVKTFPVRVSKLVKHTNLIIEVLLRLPPSANLDFIEGQYLDVIHNNILRSYSIASTSKDKEIKLIIKKHEDGEMSDYWFNKSNINDLLRIEGPKGTFFLRNPHLPLIFLATGTGIAPILSMLKKLDNDFDFNQTQSIVLYWGNRSPDEFVWQPKFKKIKVDIHRVCSKPPKTWTEEAGYVQDVALKNKHNLFVSVVYACGSNRMICNAKEKFIQAGLTGNNFYSDAFLQTY